MTTNLTLYSPGGRTLASPAIGEGSEARFSLMQEDSLTLRFSLVEPVYFPVGSYIVVPEPEGDELGLPCQPGRYYVTEGQPPTYNVETGGYDYALRLDAYYWLWNNYIFKYTPESAGREASWSLTATLDVHLSVLVRNLAALGLKYGSAPFTYQIDQTVADRSIAMTYDNVHLLDALWQMAGSSAWDCDCWIEGSVIHFGRVENGTSVGLSLGSELSSLSHSASRGAYATRIYAFGSTRNLSSDYRPADSADLVLPGIAERRLMLPASTPWVDAVEGLPRESIVEAVVVFDDVYPHRVGTLSDVTTRTEQVTTEPEEDEGSGENETKAGDDATTEPGDNQTETRTYYRYRDAGLDFSEDYLIAGEELTIEFQSGSLAGMSFGVRFNPDAKDPAEQLWEIVPNENYGRLLPDDVLCPSNGDQYVLSGFDISLVADQYVPAAEQELLSRAREYAERAANDDGTYTGRLLSDWVADAPVARDFRLGQRVELFAPGIFESARQSRVIGWTKALDLPYDQPEYTFGESTAYSRLGDVEGKVETLIYRGQTYVGLGTGSGGPYVITSNDPTPASDSNVYSALRSRREFRSKRADDTASGHVTFQKGTTTHGTARADVVEAVQQVKSPLIEAKTDASDGLVDADIIKGKRVEAPLVEAKAEEQTGLVDADRVKAVSVEATRVEAQTVEAADRVATKDLTATGRVGSKEFAEGIVGGRGWRVGADGAAELDQLTIRRFLEVPELRYNRVTVTVGDKWRAPGGGIIESVDTQAKTCRLKLEEGEIGAVRKGDICMGIYHSPVASENASADSDDSRMNRQYAGFATVYFTITGVSGERSEEFTYQLRPASERWPREVEPYAFMHFACYGSFTDPERQTSVYETRTYTRMLVGQNTWECGPQNIGLQIGDLSGLSVHDLDMEGYSAYLSNVYFTGTIKQVRPDGTPVQAANDRGQWDAAEAPYAYYDRVSHGGRIWLCIAEDGTAEEPTPSCSDWLLQVDRGDAGEAGEGALWVSVMSSRGNFFQGGVGETVLTATVRRGDADITASLPPSSFSWRRTSPDAEADALWNRVHEAVGPSVSIDDDDVTRSATFECVVTVD